MSTSHTLKFRNDFDPGKFDETWDISVEPFDDARVTIVVNCLGLNTREKANLCEELTYALNEAEIEVIIPEEGFYEQ